MLSDSIDSVCLNIRDVSKKDILNYNNR